MRDKILKKCIYGRGFTFDYIYIDAVPIPEPLWYVKCIKEQTFHTLFFYVVVYWRIYPLLILMVFYNKAFRLLKDLSSRRNLKIH